MSLNTLLTRNRKSIIGKVATMVLGLTMAAQVIPSAFAASSYTVKDGDTFYVLAQRYHTSVDALAKANSNVSASNIYSGLELNIPGEAAKETVNTASTGQAHKISADSPELSTEASSLKILGDDQVMAWGKTFDYRKTMNMTATAYSAAADENGKYGAVDYFGKQLQVGTIAVDPKVIPMGTKVLVTGHESPGLPKKAFVAIACDQGGAIKGNRIDIFIPGSQQEVSEFGIQNVKLYVLGK